MVQLIPGSVKKIWSKWDIRVMVLSSLCLQIFLIIFGNRRKYYAKKWVRILVWMAYLSADWVAALALGSLSNLQDDDGNDDKGGGLHPTKSNNQQIMAFWAPFLLLHLGGPDTITAYSLEDNELWLRHLLTLLVQVGAAFYVFFRSWTTSTYHLSLLAIPMFVAGIIKFGERTWALRSASTDRFREYSALNTGGGQHKIIVSVGNPSTSAARNQLGEAYELFHVLRRLYSGVKVYVNDSTLCEYISRYSSGQSLFELVEIELGFLYDVLYTKASVVYSRKGMIFRGISLVCCISTSVVFCILVNKKLKLYSIIDITITYLLSFGAIALELYAMATLLLTDWTLYWLSTQQNHLLYGRVFRAISSLRSSNFCGGTRSRRWSESVPQFNLIELSLKETGTPHYAKIARILGAYEMYEKYWYTTSQNVVPIGLKDLIFGYLRESKDHYSSGAVLTWKGNHALQIHGLPNLDELQDQSLGKTILAWHVATDLCYQEDHNDYSKASPNPKCNFSKLLSNYMLYIMIIRPSMLSKSLGLTPPLSEMCAKLIEFVRKKGQEGGRDLLYDALPTYFTTTGEPDEAKRSLFHARLLALKLQKLETERKWLVITDVWIEILCYAANQCEWKQHAQALTRGGELLTHVRHVMENFRFSEQHNRVLPQFVIDYTHTGTG